MKCIEEFNKKYSREPDAVAFCPYRICPIGAHSDHNLGKVLGFAINFGIHIAYGAKRNGVVEISSLQFKKRAQWHISRVPEEKENDWADYLRGATLVLNEIRPLNVGICAVIDGDLPIGGLSSSAAVIIAFLQALCAVNSIELTNRELIDTALKAENNYVGVSCGKLDQSCEVFCRKDNLLHLDTKDDSFELIPKSTGIKPFEIAIFFSGVERTLVGSKFNMRVDELRSAAYALKAYAGMEYGKFSETYLRDVPVDVYHEYKDRLPLNWAKRAEHWYAEFDRVRRGTEAWKSGDIEQFGSLVFESGLSSIVNYETGSDELKTLYEIMTKTDGIYGGRFSGAGFKGCCMALIDPAKRDSVFETVQTKYLAAFPALKGQFKAITAETTDGVGKE